MKKFTLKIGLVILAAMWATVETQTNDRWMFSGPKM